MAEWLFEAGIGEDRAALVEDGEIVEIAIDRDDGRAKAGAIVVARLARNPDATGRAAVILPDGGEALIDRLPSGIAEGAELIVEIVREAIPEPGNPKLPKVRAAVEGTAPVHAPSLRGRIAGTDTPFIALLAHQPDRLEQAGWSEAIEQAATGLVPFDGGGLRIALTPAMTLIDVDGGLRPLDLARAGADASARAIRKFDIGGSIGIDLPTLATRADRQAVAAAVDLALPQPFERTAVNGFGFLQIVRRRVRPSILELIRSDPIGAAALALIRRAERSAIGGQKELVGAPAVIARIEARPDWLDALQTRTGAGFALRADPALPISGGHVEDRIA